MFKKHILKLNNIPFLSPLLYWPLDKRGTFLYVINNPFTDSLTAFAEVDGMPIETRLLGGFFIDKIFYFFYIVINPEFPEGDGIAVV